MLLSLLAALAAFAQATDTTARPDASRLVAAVYDAPPFAIRNDDGTWDGVAVELWREIGRAEGFEAALVEVAADELIDAVADGHTDLALTATATAEGERRVDFVHPYHVATLGVAEPRGIGLWEVLTRLFSPTFLRITLGLTLLLLVVGVVAWLLERSANEDDFRPGLRGVWDGFYWAGVTMSTIGYGDKAPKTVRGQSLALVWMLISMGVTAALTAAVVSALGFQGDRSNASLLSAVRGHDVGVVEGSTAAAYLAAERVRVRAFPTVEAGLGALERDSVDVFVNAAPVLESALHDLGLGRLQVTVTQAEPEPWALAVPEGSALRERLSRAVLAHTRTPAWQATLERYGIGTSS